MTDRDNFGRNPLGCGGFAGDVPGGDQRRAFRRLHHDAESDSPAGTSLAFWGRRRSTSMAISIQPSSAITSSLKPVSQEAATMTWHPLSCDESFSCNRRRKDS